MEPVVSVVIPTYNRSALIARAVRSALEQPGVAADVIVVDDGSMDNTREVLEPWMPRITYLTQVNQGQAAARNRGAAAARGQYVVFLDSDDVLVPGILQRACQELARHLDYGGVYGRVLNVTSSGEPAGEWPTPTMSGDIFGMVVCGNTLQVGQCLLRREAVAGLRPVFDNTLRASEDLQFFLRLTRVHRMVFLPEVFVHRMLHEGMMTRGNPHIREDLVERRLRILRETFGADAAAIERQYIGRHVLAEWYRTSAYMNASWNRPQKAREFMWKSLRRWPFQPRAYVWLCYQALPPRLRAAVGAIKRSLAGTDGS